MDSCGGIGEPGILGKCKQPSSLFVKVHAFFSIQFSQHCYQLHGNSILPCSSWWLLIWCLFNQLLHISDGCNSSIPCKNSTFPSNWVYFITCILVNLLIIRIQLRRKIYSFSTGISNLPTQIKIFQSWWITQLLCGWRLNIVIS